MLCLMKKMGKNFTEIFRFFGRERKMEGRKRKEDGSKTEGEEGRGKKKKKIELQFQ